MSTYYSLCCKQCQKEVFITSRTTGSFGFSGNRENVLGFLYAHNFLPEHELEYLSEHDLGNRDYEEWEGSVDDVASKNVTNG